MSHRRTCLFVVVTLMSVAGRHTAYAENWPQWRGPRGDGTSLDTGLRFHWDAHSGIAWKTDLPEWGTSTPAIWGDAMFVTSHQGENLLALKLDRRSGAIEWTQAVGQGTAARTHPNVERQKFHRLHNLASPSPVTDGRLVVVHFGNGDLAAYDFAGKLLWRRNLQDDYGTYTIWWGHANSPVLYHDLVISVCMQDSLDGVDDKPAASYLVAHDLQTGQERWKTARMTGAAAEQADAYTTPLLVDVHGARGSVGHGRQPARRLRPRDGQATMVDLAELVGRRTVTGPTAGDGMIYVTRGMRGPLLALNPDARPTAARTGIAWQYRSRHAGHPLPRRLATSCCSW